MIKLENNWKKKSLENLEKDCWPVPDYDSYLITRVHAIRKLPLADLSHEDIAMMLRQKFSLDYIVPLAIDKLNLEKMEYEDLYKEEAILEAILKIPTDFWASNKNYWTILKKIINKFPIDFPNKKRGNFDEAG